MDVDPLAKLRADLEAAPNDPEPHLRLAGHFFEQGDYEEAAGEAQRSLQLAPDSVQARLLLGKAQMRQGCPSEAAFQFAQVLSRHRDHAEAAACHESVRRITALIDVVRSQNPPELQLDVRNHVVVLTLAGMLAPYTEDGDLTEPFERLTIGLHRLLQLGQIGCVVDMRRVHFVTSFFLSKLLSWRRKVVGETQGMAICGARPEIYELLTSSRIVRVIPLVDSMAEAMRIVCAADQRDPSSAQ